MAKFSGSEPIIFSVSTRGLAQNLEPEPARSPAKVKPLCLSPERLHISHPARQAVARHLHSLLIIHQFIFLVLLSPWRECVLISLLRWTGDNTVTSRGLMRTSSTEFSSRNKTQNKQWNKQHLSYPDQWPSCGDTVLLVCWQSDQHPSHFLS